MLGSVGNPVLSPTEKCCLCQIPAASLTDLLANVTDPIYPAGRNDISENIWIGGIGNITPIHFDTSDNLLAQLAGRKNVLLWDSWQYDLLDLNPLGSAHDRQSLTNVLDPDHGFSNFNNASALRHELVAGQILHIPSGWPHHVYTEEFSVSVSYWWPFEGLLTVHDAFVAAGRDPARLEGVIE